MNKKDFSQLSLELHEQNQGKIEVTSKVPLTDKDDLSVAYTPGVAAPCLEIESNPDLLTKYTCVGNSVAVITDGSAVLGLGNIGAKAGMPVMEGKCILFKSFAGIDAYPILLESQETSDIIATIKNISGGFSGINLEDIAAPKCFEVEQALSNELTIPVFHDDQHGTAIVVLAALINALKIVDKKPEDLRVVINGVGAAGTAIIKLLKVYGVTDIISCDRSGIIDERKTSDQNKLWIAQNTNPRKVTGQLQDAIIKSDVFIGVSSGNVMTSQMVRLMNKDAIVFALANPIPEIDPESAYQGGARIVGTGRSDYVNQINNVLVFPGIFRALLDLKISKVTDKIKLATAHAIANTVVLDELHEEMILPSIFNKNVVTNIVDHIRSLD